MSWLDDLISSGAADKLFGLGLGWGAEALGLNDPQIQRTGYLGEIPKYDAVRERVPDTYDPLRRPGSSGQRYFTDTQFLPRGSQPAGLGAEGLAALNLSNIARQTRPVAPVTTPVPVTTNLVSPAPLARGGIVGFQNDGLVRHQEVTSLPRNMRQLDEGIQSLKGGYRQFKDRITGKDKILATGGMDSPHRRPSEGEDYLRPVRGVDEIHDKYDPEINSLRTQLYERENSLAYPPIARFDPRRIAGDDPMRQKAHERFVETDSEVAELRKRIEELIRTRDLDLAHFAQGNLSRMESPWRKSPFPVPIEDLPTDKNPDKTAYIGDVVGQAKGGIIGLRRGRYVDGPTSGMADDVPANIEGTQEARLSDGEFVVPADVVSHIGNGNSDAGADELYDMMDRVRKARTGTTKQAKEIDPREFLPA